MKIVGPIDRLHQILRREGIRVAICRAVHKVLGVPGEIEEGRRLVNRHLRNLYGNTVAHGVFKGMRLSEDQWWGGSYLASKILGTYEQHIAELLERLADPDGVLIDIGAADGYFAIGCLKSSLFSRAICFEIAEAGREKILANAIQNDMADAVSIHGAADRDEIIKLLANIKSGTILCDIEGAEFDLFDTNLLHACKHLNVIIELHDWTPEKTDRALLVQRAGEHSNLEFLRYGNIEVEKFPELFKFRDDFRLLAFSEGRGRMGDWLVMRPKSVT